MSQKLEVKRVANTLAIVTAIVYIICIVLLWVVPNFVISLGDYLMHGIDLSSIYSEEPMTISSSLISLVLGIIAAWLFGALFAIIYNKLAK